MKLKKRKKKSRIRGSQTAFGGFRQKRKGHGNSGGHGMAGSGKRGDHKKQKVLESADGEYFGKRGLTSRGSAKKVNKVLNLEQIKENFSGDKIELKDYKILGKGGGFKGVIIAREASESAIKKMAGAGGSIEISEKKPTEPLVVKGGGKVKAGGGEVKVVEKKVIEKKKSEGE